MLNTQYVLTLSEEQAQMVCTACEFYTRIRIGQWKEIIWQNLDLSIEDFSEVSDMAEEKLLEARAYIFPELSHSFGHSYGVGKFTDADISWEINEVVRHCIAYKKHPEGGITVNFGEPMSFSGRPLPKCVAVEDGGDT